MNELFKQLLFVRNGGETRRYHGWPVLRQQNDAEHCFHVAMICQLLYNPRKEVILAALTSDLAEWRTGDIPSPSKRSMDHIFPGFRAKWNAMEAAQLAKVGLDYGTELTEAEKRQLSFADAVDGAMYCIRERAMGNKFIGACFFVYRRYLYVFVDDPDAEQDERDCVAFIERQWREACDASSINHSGMFQ